MLGVRRYQRGDTIIEVLLALAVFSLVSMLSMQIMQQGTNAAQRAVEITLVREEIDSQAEALRSAHAEYARLRSNGADPVTLSASPWHAITEGARSTNSSSDGICPTKDDLSNVFTLNPLDAVPLVTEHNQAGNASGQPPYAQIYSNTAYGIWIERTSSGIAGASVTPGLYTFRIRACWDDPANLVPMTLETTVRLYEIK